MVSAYQRLKTIHGSYSQKKLDTEAGLKHEVYMIAIYKRKIDGGILINLTPGGESGSYPKTEEHERKIAEGNTGVSQFRLKRGNVKCLKVLKRKYFPQHIALN